MKLDGPAPQTSTAQPARARGLSPARQAGGDAGRRVAAGRPCPSRSAAPRGAFARTRQWAFDLDNTPYPSECKLSAQVDRRMGEFIARYLGVPPEYARHLQKTYYRQSGTTLAGL